jgi:Flp pilus assembly pilin Flp
MKKIVGQIIREEKGAAVVEYVVLVSLVIAILILSITFFGDQVLETYNNTRAKMTAGGM